MSESFGTRLRQRREEHNVDLSTVAQRTKIKLSLLQALERDDLSQWPSGLFRRAYVRAYAQAIGLDPDAIVREFLEVYPDPVEAVEEAAALDANNGSRTPATRLRNIVGSAFESISRIRRGGLAAGDDLLTPGVALQAAPPLRSEAPQLPGPPAPEPAQAEAPSAPSVDPDLTAVAHVCTELGRVQAGTEVQPLLSDAARILNAKGLIVWIWDSVAAELRPAVVCGYSERVLAQLPDLPREADNATAAAFRTGLTCAISGSGSTSGALAIPLLTPTGCAGVLAIELPPGAERSTPVRAVAIILAAALAQLTGGTQAAASPPEAETAIHAS